MSAIVKISMDLKNGSIQIESPAEELESIFNHLRNFIPSISDNFDSSKQEDGEHKENEKKIHDDELESESAKKRTRKSSNKSPENFKIVELNLKEDLRKKFKDFYQSKSPKSQNPQISTVMYWLIENLKKESLSKDEIFTGLKTVGEKAPTRLTPVLHNLKAKGLIKFESDGKFALTHIGEDYVKDELPEKKQ